ncbi:hypothetical protein [Desulfovibrio desulfuricans]|uniref:hypothetical protein n=1 Tax=Desulfovibrio desulfuricans TaxID=876 RepID=UPI0015A53168|nr:hypothetical protein [Desulfovibrio desulfuricans]
MQWLLNGESSLQSSAVASLAEASALRPVIPAVRVIEMGREAGAGQRRRCRCVP